MHVQKAYASPNSLRIFFRSICVSKQLKPSSNSLCIIRKHTHVLKACAACNSLLFQKPTLLTKADAASEGIHMFQKLTLLLEAHASSTSCSSAKCSMVNPTNTRDKIAMPPTDGFTVGLCVCCSGLDWRQSYHNAGRGQRHHDVLCWHVPQCLLDAVLFNSSNAAFHAMVTFAPCSMPAYPLTQP